MICNIGNEIDMVGHIDRMDEYHSPRRVSMSEVSGGRVRSRHRLGWMDGVKVALGSRVIMVEASRHCTKDRKVWKALVHMSMIEFHASSRASGLRNQQARPSLVSRCN